MSRLPTDTILTCAEMAQVLLSDPRFLHLSEDEILSALHSLYDVNSRDEDREARLGFCVSAVPEALWHAERQGKAGKLYVAEHTIGAVGELLGSFCCLCGDSGHVGQHFWLTDLVALRLAPNVQLFDDDGRDDGRTLVGGPPILCRQCGNAFEYWSRRDNRAYSREQSDADSFINDCLVRLLSRPDFIRRVQRHASVFSSLRFDPRGFAHSSFYRSAA